MEPLKIGIAGLGTVGASVVKILHEEKNVLQKRCGRKLVVTAVSARTKNKDRGIDLTGVTWHDDPVALAADPNVDVVVELMGGAEGKARELVTKALQNGKSVVTANKALLALHGEEIFSMVDATGGSLLFEASVAGGIPIIKALREGLAANKIEAVYGILNGTCNYILTQMRETGAAFADVLADAQKLGYAEADPSFDVDGIDAGHKISILSGIAFGMAPNFSKVNVKGIRAISTLDIEYAAQLDCRIKLLGIARKTERGVEQSVEPCLVPLDKTIAAVEGPFNAVFVKGNFVGETLYVGRGAGGGPTASAVVADIVDIARGGVMLPLGIKMADRATHAYADMSQRSGSYYLRLSVLDEPGVIADVSAILRDFNVSLESVLQHRRAPGQAVPVVLTSHETVEGKMLGAVDKIAKLKAVVEPPHLMRIEAF